MPRIEDKQFKLKKYRPWDIQLPDYIKEQRTNEKEIGTEIGTNEKEIGTEIGTNFKLFGTSLGVIKILLNNLFLKKELITKHITIPLIAAKIPASKYNVRRSITRLKKRSLINIHKTKENMA